jgi:propionate CoA-transferase
MRAPAILATADQAVAAIPYGATIAIGGFVGAGHPEMLTAALERRFLETGTPRNLTLYYCAGQGDRGDRGLNHLAHKGLVKRVIGGHWNLAPKLGTLALANEIEAYNLPQGVLCCLLREIAAKRPGLITQVGLNTFIDPLMSGGRMNARTVEPLVERLELDGKPWLRYKPVPVHVGLIRATYADARGNLSMDGEGLVGEVLPIAQAAKNHGGIVIAQVESLVDSLPDPKSVRVPGILVDYIVTSGGVQHDQTFGETFNEEFVVSQAAGFELPAMPESERKVIGRRALQEVRAGDIVNLGIGLPESVAMVAAETGRLGDFTLTVESGPIGGVPASGLSFGCSHFPEAIIDQPAQFDFYDGGGVDIAVLGAVEVDAQGSVNVTSFADRFAGVGGFVNIAQSARRLVFCCTFLAKGRPKFVREIQHVCFHGPTALARGQQVLYVTDRAVFELVPEGLRLVEILGAHDLHQDVLSHMQFHPLVSHSLIHSP